MSKEQVAVIAVPDMHKVDHRYLTSVTIMRLRDKAAVAIADLTSRDLVRKKLRKFYPKNQVVEFDI